MFSPTQATPAVVTGPGEPHSAAEVKQDSKQDSGVASSSTVNTAAAAAANLKTAKVPRKKRRRSEQVTIPDSDDEVNDKAKVTLMGIGYPDGVSMQVFIKKSLGRRSTTQWLVRVVSYSWLLVVSYSWHCMIHSVSFSLIHLCLLVVQIVGNQGPVDCWLVC